MGKSYLPGTWSLGWKVSLCTLEGCVHFRITLLEAILPLYLSAIWGIVKTWDLTTRGLNCRICYQLFRADNGDPCSLGGWEMVPKLVAAQLWALGTNTGESWEQWEEVVIVRRAGRSQASCLPEASLLSSVEFERSRRCSSNTWAGKSVTLFCSIQTYSTFIALLPNRKSESRRKQTKNPGDEDKWTVGERTVLYFLVLIIVLSLTSYNCKRFSLFLGNTYHST
jgi:hypothetical protein